jgi:NADPH:quinone reductase-like Zn-dependent oxidoreductase
MKAAVITQPGGPEVLRVREVPKPEPADGEVLVRVHAFGVNHAETYFRSGLWDGSGITGIELAGTVEHDPSGKLEPGTTVVSITGGMGRTRNGSYAEYTVVAADNVAPVETKLSFTELAAIPESFATAWATLFGNLDLQPGQKLLVRGGTSALGRAAVTVGAHAGAEVIATSRYAARAETLRELGASDVLVDDGELAPKLNGGVDAVLELVGTTTLRDSVRATRMGGRVVHAGFLGGGEPVEGFDPFFDLPNRVQLSFFASIHYGTPGYPLNEIPFQTIVERVESGEYKWAPAHVYKLDEIADAHRLMDSGKANGKIVVTVD